MSTETYEAQLKPAKKPARSQLIPIIILIIFAFVGIDKLAGLYADGVIRLPDRWVVFSDQGGRFAVDMPGQPQDLSQMAGRVVRSAGFHMFRAVGSGRREAYSAGYFDYSDQILRSLTPDTILDNGLAGASRSNGNSLISSRAVSYNGNPGREAILSGTSAGQASLQQIRVYLIGHRLHILMYTTLGTSTDTPNSRRFMDSFKTF